MPHSGSICGLELKPYHSKRQKMAAKVLLEQALRPIAAFSEVAVPRLVPLRESVPGRERPGPLQGQQKPCPRACLVRAEKCQFSPG